MMRDTQLILFEGIPGSGKTTMAKRLHAHLLDRGIDADVYLEGDSNHPVDLGWHAYFTKGEYRRLTAENPSRAEAIESHTIVHGDDYLVQYKDTEGNYFEGDLFALLQSRELCIGTEPAVSFEKFAEIFADRWRRFVEERDARRVSIFEGAFFQHQLHDLMRLYRPERAESVGHLKTLLEQFSALNPILFYLSQTDVRESLTRIAKQREKPHFASDAYIAFQQERKRIEYQAMSQLPLRSYVFDNSDCDWDRVLRGVLGALDFS